MILLFFAAITTFIHHVFCINENITQIHLSLSNNINTMGIDYVVTDDVDRETYVQYKLSDSDDVMVIKSNYSYLDNIGYLHNCKFDDLKLKSKYEYRIAINEEDFNDESGANTSAWYTFYTGPYVHEMYHRKKDHVEFNSKNIGAVYADLGMYNGQSLEHIINSSKNNDFDYMVHIGDISYDLFSDNSANGNEFMQQLSQITTNIPYMVGEGNHEKGDNFTEYNIRFKAIESVSGSTSHSHSNHFYSFDVGLIHYIMVSTEVYSYPTQAKDGPSSFTVEEQLKWLEIDLKYANRPEVREQRPWIVLMGHRPWYTMAKGFNHFDELACQYGIDLYITGHVHNYQRWKPMHLGAWNKALSHVIPTEVDEACVSEDGHTYTDPKFMPVIVTGSAGCHSPEPEYMCAVMKAGSNLFMKDSLSFCSAAYGYGHLQAVNHTHLYWEFIQTHIGESYIDMKNKEDWTSKIPFSMDDSDIQRIKAKYPHFLNSKTDFIDEISALASNWKEFEDQLDKDVEAEMMSGREPSRLIRDYLYIVQHNHQGNKTGTC